MSKPLCVRAKAFLIGSALFACFCLAAAAWGPSPEPLAPPDPPEWTFPDEPRQKL